MTTYQCPKCPSAAFCSCRIEPVQFPPIPIEAFGSFGARVQAEVQTRPAAVTAESLAALEQRLAECERRLEVMYKAHEVDRRTVRDERVDQIRAFRVLQNAVESLRQANDEQSKRFVGVWDRLTALEQAASQQPSHKPSNRRPPARGRSRTKASKKARRGAASSPIRKRGAGRRKT